MMKGSLKWNKPFRQTVSVRNNILSDDESTATLFKMVSVGRIKLEKESQYRTFREKMRLLGCSQKVSISRDEEPPLLLGDFLCWAEFSYTDDEQKIENIVDAYIIELLRFIALKILLEGVPDAESNRIYHSPKHFEHYLIPSIPIREAWKTLLMMPVMYSRICYEMGTEPIDYDPECNDLQLEYNLVGISNEVIQRNRDNYRWTFSSYERLFVIEPPLIFWPRLKGDDEEDREENILEEINDYVQRLSVAISDRVGGISNQTLPKDITIQHRRYSWFHT